MDEEDEHFLHASHQKCILLSGTECHITNYLLTELAQAIPGNIGLGRFRMDLAALGPYCHDLGPILPTTALALGY